MFEIPLIPAAQSTLTGRNRARFVARRLQTFSTISRKFADACWPFEIRPTGLVFEARRPTSTIPSDIASVRRRLHYMGIDEPVARVGSSHGRKRIAAACAVAS